MADHLRLSWTFGVLIALPSERRDGGKLVMEGHTASPACWMCGNPVALEECNTDEDGRAVHEQCYVERVKRESEVGGPWNQPVCRS